METFLELIRTRRRSWEEHPDEVYDILEAGSKQASQEAGETLAEVSLYMRINYYEDRSLLK